MRLELGEISDEEFAGDRARRPRAHPRDQRPAAGSDLDVARRQGQSGVEIESWKSEV